MSPLSTLQQFVGVPGRSTFISQPRVGLNHFVHPSPRSGQLNKGDPDRARTRGETLILTAECHHSAVITNTTPTPFFPSMGGLNQTREATTGTRDSFTKGCTRLYDARSESPRTAAHWSPAHCRCKFTLSIRQLLMPH